MPVKCASSMIRLMQCVTISPLVFHAVIQILALARCSRDLTTYVRFACVDR